MKYLALLIIPFLAVVLIAQPAKQESPQERNKRVVIDFYDKAINQKDFEAAKVHFGNRYT